MTDDAAKSPRASKDDPTEHYCEFPGCVRWGGLGYDIQDGSQWFCVEHKWQDYRLGKPRRIFIDDEAFGINAIMLEPRTVSIG